MKINYPVFYAVMPILEQTGWTLGVNELKRDYNVVGYIASKCFLMEKRTVYSEDGEERMEYEVSFLYQKLDARYPNEWSFVVPRFNIYDQKCITSTVVDRLYKNFADAKKEAIQKNNELLKKLSYQLVLLGNDFKDFNKRYREQEEKFKEKHEKFAKLENYIETATHFYTPNRKIKNNGILVMMGDSDRVLSESLYDFLRFYDTNTYVVNHVSYEEFLNMKEQILEFGRLSERDAQFDFSYHRDQYLLFHDKEKDYTMLYDFEHPKMSGSYIIKDDNLFYRENIIPFPCDGAFYNGKKEIKVYTTENYQDILNSYNLFEPFDYNKKDATLTLVKKEETKS